MATVTVGSYKIDPFHSFACQEFAATHFSRSPAFRRLRCHCDFARWHHGLPGNPYRRKAGSPSLHHSLWLRSSGIFFAIFAFSNLYPGIIHNPVTELRRLGLALTLGFVVLAALISVTRLDEVYPRRALLLCWIAAIVVTPLLRSIVRTLICHKPWWGIPVAVFHTGDESTEIVRELELHPEIGLRPVVLLSSSYHGHRTATVPILDIHLAASVRACGVERAMIALPETGSAKLLEDLEKFESLFPRLMIIHTSAALYSLTVNARQLAGCLAVEVRKESAATTPQTGQAIDRSIPGWFDPPPRHPAHPSDWSAGQARVPRTHFLRSTPCRSWPAEISHLENSNHENQRRRVAAKCPGKRRKPARGMDKRPQAPRRPTHYPRREVPKENKPRRTTPTLERIAGRDEPGRTAPDRGRRSRELRAKLLVVLQSYSRPDGSMASLRTKRGESPGSRPPG